MMNLIPKGNKRRDKAAVKIGRNVKEQNCLLIHLYYGEKWRADFNGKCEFLAIKIKTDIKGE